MCEQKDEKMQRNQFKICVKKEVLRGTCSQWAAGECQERMKHFVDIFVRSPVTAKNCGQDKKYIANCWFFCDDIISAQPADHVTICYDQCDRGWERPVTGGQWSWSESSSTRGCPLIPQAPLLRLILNKFMKTSSQVTDRPGTSELKEHRLISATPVMDMTSVLIQVCPQHYVMNPGDSETWCGQLCRPTSNSSASRNVVYVSLKHEFHKEFPWRLFLVLRVVRCNTLI